MSYAAPSFPSLIAAVFYLAIAAVCIAAAMRAHAISPKKAVVRFWEWAGVAMIAFAAARIAGLEDLLRSALRASFDSRGILEQRTAFQQPAVALVLTGAIVAMGLIVWRQRSRETRPDDNAVLLAKLALAGFAMLWALRIISLHAVDSLLFTPLLGPIKLNWVLDIGLAGLLAISACWFWLKSGNMRE